MPGKQYLGTVSLLTQLSDTGRVCFIVSIDGINKDIDKKTEQASQQRRFDPVRRDGRPVPALATVYVDYWTLPGGQVIGDPPQIASEFDWADQFLQAGSNMNIFELPSFQMHAQLQIENNGEPLRGTLLLLWNGPDQWREDISFPGYSETQIGGKDTVFLKRTTDFLPLRIQQVHGTLGFSSSASYGSFFHPLTDSKATVTDVHAEKVNDKDLVCLNGKNLCVDPSTHSLARQLPFVDSNNSPVGAKFFPGHLSWVDHGKMLVEINVTDLKVTDRLPASSFQAPPDATSRPGCMNPIPPRLLSRVVPKYPNDERRSNAQGNVAISAVISKEGIPGDLHVVSSVSPGLDGSAMDALRQWRYQPATCGSASVDVEMILTVIFSLQ
ncbi:MAG TPA: energy transducer TonB [Terriglobales bacterium]